MHPNLTGLGGIVAYLTGQKDEKSVKLGEKLADQAIAYMRARVNDDLKDDKRKPKALQRWDYIAQLQASARRPEKEREVYEQMLATLGQEDALLGKLAGWYKQNKKGDLARATYLKYKDTIEGQHQVAVSWVEENKFDQAIEVYRKLAVQDAKATGQVAERVADIYRRANKPDLAIAVYRDLAVSDKDHAAGYVWEIAETLYFAHRWQEALSAYRPTERTRDDELRVKYLRMADCHRHLKQWDEAIALYGQMMASVPAYAAEGLLAIAYTQEQAERKELAIKFFKQVCSRFPKTPQGSDAHARLNDKYKISVTLGGAKD